MFSPNAILPPGKPEHCCLNLPLAQNGRLKGEMKKTLRRVIEKYNLPVIITPNQNLVLRDLDPAVKDAIAAELKVRAWGLLVFFWRMKGAGREYVRMGMIGWAAVVLKVALVIELRVRRAVRCPSECTCLGSGWR